MKDKKEKRLRKMKWEKSDVALMVLCVAVIIQSAISSAVVNYQSFISEKVRKIYFSFACFALFVGRILCCKSKYEVIVLSIWNVILLEHFTHIRIARTYV